MINGGYGRKMVVKELFGKVKIYRLHTRVKLPVPISEISDYDLSAPFVSECGEYDPHFYKALDMRKFR
jgi:hypothetical protein